MRKFLSLLGLSLSLSLGSAFAASPVAPAKPASSLSDFSSLNFFSY